MNRIKEANQKFLDDLEFYVSKNAVHTAYWIKDDNFRVPEIKSRDIHYVPTLEGWITAYNVGKTTFELIPTSFYVNSDIVNFINLVEAENYLSNLNEKRAKDKRNEMLQEAKHSIEHGLNVLKRLEEESREDHPTDREFISEVFKS